MDKDRKLAENSSLPHQAYKPTATYSHKPKSGPLIGPVMTHNDDIMNMRKISMKVWFILYKYKYEIATSKLVHRPRTHNMANETWRLSQH